MQIKFREVKTMQTLSSDYKLGQITIKGLHAMIELDKKFIGTEDYIGLASFWNHEYRYYLRDITYAKKRKIHKEWLKVGLDLEGISDQHFAIIKKQCKL